MKAGIRFWQVAQDKPMRATLYESDGFTEYFQPSGEDMMNFEPNWLKVEMTSSMGKNPFFANTA